MRRQRLRIVLEDFRVRFQAIDEIGLEDSGQDNISLEVKGKSLFFRQHKRQSPI